MIEAKGHGRGSPEIFRLVKTLGHGGFADTYLAEVLSPQLAHAWGTETVAIKIPKDRRKEKTLIQELQTNNLVTEVLRGLAGATNVVRYLGFEDYDGKWVMVMEYVAGGSARDVVGHLGCQKPMDIDRAVGIVRGVLQGLSAIHRAGVFHRDIKPENILLDNQGVPKVADLGIATMLHSNEQASSTVGTLAYMSPEILGPDGASFESDIWSVGVTLYEMLTGRWPFGDETTPMGSMVDLIRSKDPAPPNTLRPQIPRHVGDAVCEALEKDPQRRFSGSADKMIAALRGPAAKELVTATQGRDIVDARLKEVRRLLLSPDAHDAAKEKLQELVEEFPSDARPCQHLGELLSRHHQYADAIATFKRGIERDRKNGVLYYDLAMAHLACNQRPRAVSNLSQAKAFGLPGDLARAADVLLKTLRKGNGGARP